MKKFLLLSVVLFFVQNLGFSMIPPEYMIEDINNSKIKSPAIVKKVKTIKNYKGNRTQKVTFEGLYQNAGVIYEGTCHNFKSILPWNIPMLGSKFYYPKKGERVYVTIYSNGGAITSLVNMDENFEKRIQKTPSEIKFDSSGAYFEK